MKIGQKLPLDKCLNDGLISEEEHSSALSFRKLYYMFFGNLMLKSNTPNIYSKKSFIPDEEKQAKAYKFMQEILKELELKNIYSVILDHCIFDKECKTLHQRTAVKCALGLLHKSLNRS
jgi:hypothetical protein